MTGPAGDRPPLSVVVVVHDMARELPRTLRSLDPAHQIGVSGDDYEVVVVDNGSQRPVDDLVARFPGRLRLERIEAARPSPAGAANHGLRLAHGDLVGLVVDGARLASPGLLAGARRAAALADRPVITAPAFHLGSTPHMRAAEVGYDQAAEDRLLVGSGWERDGYRLFTISTPAGSWGRGLFGPAGESSSLFCRRDVWDELGGLDERFVLPGGGLVNHDLLRRACALDGAELVVLLGEGTFHQFHGGAATSRRHSWAEMHAEYEAVTGKPHEPPGNLPLFVGRARPELLPFIERSARQAIDRTARHGNPPGAVQEGGGALPSPELGVGCLAGAGAAGRRGAWPEDKGGTMASTQRTAPGAFERGATSAWRAVGRRLPESISEPIRRSVKRALRAVGLIRRR